MKLLSICFLLLIVSTAAFSQMTVIMKIPGMTAANGDKLTAFEGNTSFPATATVPAFDDIKIKKSLSPSSYLIRSLITKATVNTAEFDFYDNTNLLVYQLLLTDLKVTKFSALSPECPTCQSLSNEIWFSYSTITYIDPVNNLRFGWNLKKNVAQ